MTIENFKMPLGRIVAGNTTLWENAIDYHTRKPKIGADGQIRKENRVSIAYPKEVFLKEVWPHVLQEVAKIYPQYANLHPDQCETSRFGWKIINGDSSSCPQNSQVPYNTREGYPGNYVVKITTSAFLPKTFKFESDAGAYRQLEENEVKCGDYVVASLNITAHSEKDGGIYWNPNCYELVAYGKEIKSAGAIDPMKAFGGATYQLPPGASLTPVSSAPANVLMPGMPAPAQAAPVGMPAPAYDFVANAGIPQMPSAPVTPAQGFTPSAPTAGNQQQFAPQTANTTVPFATTFPTR